MGAIARRWREVFNAQFFPAQVKTLWQSIVNDSTPARQTLTRGNTKFSNNHNYKSLGRLDVDYLFFINCIIFWDR